MVFDMCQGYRHVRAHGAVAQPRRGNHGLVAGCAFAKDLRKAFIHPVKQEWSAQEGGPGTCVHDITLRCKGRQRKVAQHTCMIGSRSSRPRCAETIWYYMTVSGKT